MNIFTMNLGSTSTKVGLFAGKNEVVTHTFRHDKAQLSALGGVEQQKDYRKRLIEDWLTEQGKSPADFDVYSVRCGLIRPVKGGLYRISQAAVDDAMSGKYEMHAANLGLMIGLEWSQTYGIPAIFVDAPVTDELMPKARITGFAGTQRRSVLHALNAKRTLRMHCEKTGQDPFNSSFVVIHMGGGITVSAIRNLEIIDVNNGVDGEGPFSPERAGSLSNAIVLNLVKENQGDTKKVRDLLYQKGGLVSYFGTNEVRYLLPRAKEEPEVRLVLDAMVYNIVKQAAAMAMALEGKVDGILQTGGIAYNPDITEAIANQCAWIAPSFVYPGEEELQALAEGAVRYLTGGEQAKTLEDSHV
ncbi:MAG: butyrate kinase [Clostridiales bacterium]|jgi:butyrate kinase|nr:butyrate kinase [Clostridiales bacterium]